MGSTCFREFTVAVLVEVCTFWVCSSFHFLFWFIKMKEIYKINTRDVNRCLWIQRTKRRRSSSHYGRWVTFTAHTCFLTAVTETWSVIKGDSACEHFPSQVGCKALVCPEQFKMQQYCDMLRQICPEIESSSPGHIKSARYSSNYPCVWAAECKTCMKHVCNVLFSCWKPDHSGTKQRS